VLIFTPTDENDCITCHQANYDAEHAVDGFPVTCTDCHSDTEWSGAVIDHASLSGGYTLTGAHEPLGCNNCHTQPGNVLIFTPTDETDCIACHQTNYDAEHASDMFPLACADCHNVNMWEDASFDHDADYFPIYSGSHREAWSNCGSCHTAAPDVSTFSCTACHGETDMNQKHNEVSRYFYDSMECLSCHPQGNTDGLD
jgi:hypothetical protein